MTFSPIFISSKFLCHFFHFLCCNEEMCFFKMEKRTISGNITFSSQAQAMWHLESNTKCEQSAI